MNKIKIVTMCNCGNKRSEYRKANLPQNATAVSPPAVGATNARIKFMYTGRSSLKILGNVSGHLYYFRIRGQMLEVSPDDSSSMMSHPELKIVKA